MFKNDFDIVSMKRFSQFYEVSNDY